MRDNPIQFAVVREDPEIEAALVRATGVRRAMLIGSGGCTALSLRALFPQLSLTLVDPNPAQLDLIDRKARLLAEGAARARFNVGDDSSAGLNACGNFESLFRGLRDFLREFVMPAAELEALVTEPVDASARRETFARLVGHRYWKTAFELFFSDALLNTMFGPEATRHAQPGSYPAYFRQVFEAGLGRADAADNYFLHHVFLGHYLDRPASLPPYLTRPPVPPRFEIVAGTVDAVDDFGRFELIALSNIFDWMDDADVKTVASRIKDEARPGATVVFRQLNNSTDFAALFAPQFQFDAAEAAPLHAADRSLFYSALSIGRKRGSHE